MVDRILGVSALSCLSVAGLLFLSRLLGIVSPYSHAYGPVLWAFFWTFGPGLVLTDAFLVRRSRAVTQARTPGLRWGYGVGAFLALLIPGAAVFLTMCVGMNFMGQ